MKKLYMILALCLTLLLCGCGQSAIVGRWEGSGLLSLLAVDTDAALTEQWTFCEDGTAYVRLTTPEGEVTLEQELRYAVTEDTLTLTREDYSIGVLYTATPWVITAGPDHARLTRVR